MPNANHQRLSIRIESIPENVGSDAEWHEPLLRAAFMELTDVWTLLL